MLKKLQSIIIKNYILRSIYKIIKQERKWHNSNKIIIQVKPKNNKLYFNVFKWKQNKKNYLILKILKNQVVLYWVDL